MGPLLETWWSSLTDEQRREICMLHSHRAPSWMLESLHAAGIPLIDAIVDGEPRRLVPTIVFDLLPSEITG